LFTSISDIINLQINSEKNYALKMAVALKWKECVGEDIALKTSVQAIRDGIIFASAANAVWTSHLTAMKKDIIDKLNSMIIPHKINDIRFKASYRSKKQEYKKEIKEIPQITAEERNVIKEKSSVIKDEKERLLFENIMEKDIIWQKEKLAGGGGFCPICGVVSARKGICFYCKIR